MIPILRGIRMAGEPTDRRFWTVVFLASVDFCCILLATERYDKGNIKIGTAWLIAGVVFSLIGWKWPQIAQKFARKKPAPEIEADNTARILAEALARTQARIGLVPELGEISIGHGTKETPDGHKADGVAVLLLVTIRNYGGATLAHNYELFVKLAEGRIEQGIPHIISPKKIIAQTRSGKALDVESDLLPSEIAIPQGGSATGRLAFFFIGDDVHQFAKAGTVMQLAVKDEKQARYAVEKTVAIVKGVY